MVIDWKVKDSDLQWWDTSWAHWIDSRLKTFEDTIQTIHAIGHIVYIREFIKFGRVQWQEVQIGEGI